MLDLLLAAIGLLGLAVASTSAKLETVPLNPPLLALGLGVLLGPEMLDLVSIPEDMHHQVMRTASRLLLAVGLMAVALRYPLSDVRQLLRQVALLLVVVLPVMAVVIGLGAMLTLGLPLGIAAVIGASLSPTDPVLASSVVTGGPAEQDMPARLRQLLSMESGANDGLALPFVLAAVPLVGATLSDDPLPGLARGLLEVVIGIVLGVVVGGVAGRLVARERRSRHMEPSAKLVLPIVLAFAVLGIVGLAHGDAILGVFVAGLAYNGQVSGADRDAEEQIDEGMNGFLVLPVFALLGIVLPWSGWAELGRGGLAFVAVALLLRRIPAVYALRRPLGLDPAGALWLGWFGPIGVAAVFYLTLSHHHGVTDPVVWHAGTLVVAASTLLHGVTAAPGRHLYSTSRSSSSLRVTSGRSA